jgi:hypothetical protein
MCRCEISFTHRLTYPAYKVHTTDSSKTFWKFIPIQKTSLRTRHTVHIHRCVTSNIFNSKQKATKMHLGCKLKMEKYLFNNVKTVDSLPTYMNSRVDKKEKRSMWLIVRKMHSYERNIIVLLRVWLYQTIRFTKRTYIKSRRNDVTKILLPHCNT